MRLVESNNVNNKIISNLYESELEEAFNPENEEKNKIIRQALRGPKSIEKNRQALKDMGIETDRREEYGYEPGETIYLRGKNGKQLSVDPDGTNVWNTGGSHEEHYKKELNFRNRHSKNYNNQEHLDFNGERGKAFDYYNYLTKPANEYQDEVDKANKVKNYRDNEDKTGYNLPDEALTPEEKSLNKRPRKYVQLNQEREELEDELAGYDEVKKKLDKNTRELKKLHEDDEVEVLKETTPYGFEEFVDASNNFEVLPGAISEVIEKLRGASLLLYYMYDDKDVPNKEKLQDISNRLDEIAKELETLGGE